MFIPYWYNPCTGVMDESDQVGVIRWEWPGGRVRWE